MASFLPLLEEALFSSLPRASFFSGAAASLYDHALPGTIQDQHSFTSSFGHSTVLVGVVVPPRGGQERETLTKSQPQSESVVH